MNKGLCFISVLPTSRFSHLLFKVFGQIAHSMITICLSVECSIAMHSNRNQQITHKHPVISSVKTVTAIRCNNSETNNDFKGVKC